ncbi:MAG: phosphoglycolate phosphatase [Leptospiraceae bacterium]|nr:MAG: phosphoglycolate phosphatase [Leptospiraceae bacterium]
MKHNIKGIIFDLDGTLIDSLLDLTESVNYALKKVGLKTYEPEIVKNFVGNGMRSLIETSINHLLMEKKIKQNDANQIKEKCLQYFLEHYDDNCIHHTDVFFGVEDFLKTYQKQYKFAILTNKSEYFTYKIINHLKMKEFFTHILTGDKETYKKPKPYGIKKIQKNWGFSNNEILMIGDHYTDILAAKNANIPSVFAIYGYGKLNGLIPEYSIKDFLSLKQLLNLINNR